MGWIFRFGEWLTDLLEGPASFVAGIVYDLVYGLIHEGIPAIIVLALMWGLFFGAFFAVGLPIAYGHAAWKKWRSSKAP